MMNCPFCNDTFRQHKLADKVIDICPSCQGVWFDPGELSEYISILLAKGQPVRPTPVDGSSLSPSRESLLSCPVCKFPLEKNNYMYDSNVIIDRCGNCGGIWTDKGEAEKIAAYSKKSETLSHYGTSLFYGLNKSHFEDINLRNQQILSVSIGLFYWGLSIFLPENFFVIVFPCSILGMLLVCFGDQIGSAIYVPVFSSGPLITQKSPGSLLRLFGWFFLALPMALLFLIISKNT